jgi:hypothetical protein
LTGINVDQDLRSELFFDDGDLFWGHAVFVETDESGKPYGADLFG